MKKHIWNIAPVVLSLAVGIICIAIFSPGTSTERAGWLFDDTTISNEALRQAPDWCKGYILNEATMRQWKEAPEEDRLATCGYFIISRDAEGLLEPPLPHGPLLFSVARLRAEDLMEELDLFARSDALGHYTVKQVEALVRLSELAESQDFN